MRAVKSSASRSNEPPYTKEEYKIPTQDLLAESSREHAQAQRSVIDKIFDRERLPADAQMRNYS